MLVPAKVQSRTSGKIQTKNGPEVAEYQNTKSAVLRVDTKKSQNDVCVGRPRLYSEEYESENSKSSKVNIRAKRRVSLITN